MYVHVDFRCRLCILYDVTTVYIIYMLVCLCQAVCVNYLGILHMYIGVNVRSDL